MMSPEYQNARGVKSLDTAIYREAAIWTTGEHEYFLNTQANLLNFCFIGLLL